MKKKSSPRFSLQLFSRENFRDPNILLRCVREQIVMLPWASPTHFGWYEPLNNVFDDIDLKKLIPQSGVGDTIYWRRKGAGKYWGRWSVPWISGVPDLGNTHSTLSIHGSVNSAQFDELIAYLKQSSLTNNCDIAYLDVATAQAIDDFPRSFIQDGELHTVTHQLREYLPGMYWATVFGPEYVSLFGMEKLLSTPAFSCKQLSDGHVFIQLTEFIDDTFNSPAELKTARVNAKKHLGIEHFYVKSEFGESLPKRIAPNFGFDGPIRVARPWGGVPPDISTEEILNGDVGSLASLLLSPEDSAIPLTSMQRQDLDFSIESVSILEAALEHLRENLRDDADKVNKTILQVGSYVGEVIRRLARSELNWIDYDAAVTRSEILENIGPQIGVALVLASNDYGQIFPLAKVQKFLENGSDDSLSLFAKVMIT